MAVCDRSIFLWTSSISCRWAEAMLSLRTPTMRIKHVDTWTADGWMGRRCTSKLSFHYQKPDHRLQEASGPVVEVQPVVRLRCPHVVTRPLDAAEAPVPPDHPPGQRPRVGARHPAAVEVVLVTAAVDPSQAGGTARPGHDRPLRRKRNPRQPQRQIRRRVADDTASRAIATEKWVWNLTEYEISQERFGKEQF